MEYRNHSDNEISIGAFSDGAPSSIKSLKWIFCKLQENSNSIYVKCERPFSTNKNDLDSLVYSKVFRSDFNEFIFDEFTLTFYTATNRFDESIAAVLAQLFFTFESIAFLFSHAPPMKDKLGMSMISMASSASLKDFEGKVDGFIAYKNIEDDVIWLLKNQSSSFAFLCENIDKQEANADEKVNKSNIGILKSITRSLLGRKKS